MGKHKRGACMADGGIVETPEQLRQRIAEKYGVTSGSDTQQPQPKPADTANVKVDISKKESPVNMLTGIKNIFAGRNAQIDKAAGYAKGGIVKGKGTPTSDDVPMKVNGQNVNLSNMEAVLPHATVMALGGPEAVKRLIEATNGKPPVEGGLREGGEYADGVVNEELLRAINMNYGNAQNSTPPNPLAVPSIPVSVGAGQAPTIYGNGGLPTTTDRVPAPIPGGGHNIPDNVGKPPAPSSSWSVGAGTAPTIYDNGGIPATTDRVPAKAPEQPAQQPSSGWSIGGGAAPTIYGNGGLPAATVQSGIDTMRGQLNNPMTTAAAPSPSAPAAPSAQSAPSQQTPAQRPAPVDMSSGQTVSDGAGGVYTPERGSGPNILNGVINMFKDSATAARTGVHYNEVKAQREASEKAAAAAVSSASPEHSPTLKTNPYGPNPMQNVNPSAMTGFITGSKPGVAPEPGYSNGRDVNGTITNQGVAQAEAERAAGNRTNLGTMDLSAQNERMAKALGYAGVDDFNTQQRQKYATQDMALLAEQMKGNPEGLRAVTQVAERQMAQNANPLDSAIKKEQLTAAQATNATNAQLVALRDAYTKETDPTKRAQLAEQYRLLSGKNAADRFIAVQGGEEIGPDGFTKIRRPSSVFDSSTHQFVTPNDQGTAQPSFKSKEELQAAIKAGKVKSGQIVMTPNGPMVVK